MKYTVIWKPAAEQKLADIWLQSTDRQAVTDAADRIDRLLKYSPGTVGKVRDRKRRFSRYVRLAWFTGYMTWTAW
jgi:hypothetical protein